MKTKVSKIIASHHNPAVASAVEIPGHVLLADVVIMGVGVAPATDFLKGNTIPLERDGGIVVDDYLRVRGLEDIYAIGKATESHVK